MTSPRYAGPPSVAATIGLYALARVALVAVVAAALAVVGVPLVIAVLVGLVVALPLSMVLFRGLRGRLDAALAEAGRRRSEERAALRRGLRGEEAASDEAVADHGTQRQPDRGQDRPDEQ